MRNGNLEQAQLLVDAGIKKDINHILLNLLASQIYKNLKKESYAISYCKNALEQNRVLKRRSNTNNVMDILIDDMKIIKEGILTSLEFNNGNSIDFFLSKMKNNDNEYSKIVTSIINNELADINKLSKLKSFTKEENLDYTLNLLKYNSNDEAKLEFFSALYDKYNSNTKYLTNFGIFLLSVNQFEEAKILLETVIQNDDYEDSVIFYLISIYTSSNDIQKIAGLLNKMESRANLNPVIDAKLKILKTKLHPILNLS
jgi:tetratricopeptide (TPR) repeat protein